MSLEIYLSEAFSSNHNRAHLTIQSLPQDIQRSVLYFVCSCGAVVQKLRGKDYIDQKVKSSNPSTTKLLLLNP